MQNLGLSDSTPRSDGWLKSLFWPTIASDVDVDYVTTQGFWVCLATGFFSLLLITGAGALAAVYAFALFLLGACGVRQRSRFAAVTLLVLQLPGLIRPGIAGLMIFAFLLANARAIWLAHRWRESGEIDLTPPPMQQNLTDLLSDRMPRLLWPKGRYVYYVLATLSILTLPFAFNFAPHAPRA